MLKASNVKVTYMNGCCLILMWFWELEIKASGHKQHTSAAQSQGKLQYKIQIGTLICNGDKTLYKQATIYTTIKVSKMMYMQRQQPCKNVERPQRHNMLQQPSPGTMKN